MISVIIVNYKTYKLTRDTLKKVFSSNINDELEVIVVDNASKDGSFEKLKREFEKVVFVENEKNLGFAKANNIGIRRSHGEYILLLNSDVEVYKDTLYKLINYIKGDHKIGAIGPKLILANGKLDHTCKRGFPTPEASLYYFLGLDKKYPNSEKYGKYRMTYVEDDKISEVDSLVGAFMLIPRKVLDQIGVLDEKFFMYGEDIDFCFRIKNKGYKIVYYPEARAVHYKGGSSKKKSYRLIYEFYRAMVIFYNKHYFRKYNILITLLVYLGILIMVVFKIMANFFKVKKND